MSKKLLACLYELAIAKTKEPETKLRRFKISNLMETITWATCCLNYLYFLGVGEETLEGGNPCLPYSDRPLNHVLY